MKSGTLFVTGTDTGVGKTRVACALIRQARSEGIKVFGWKPVATGCSATPAGLRNDDALALQAAAGTDEPYDLLNPYAFEPAIAPHLAAALAGRAIRTQELDRVHRDLQRRHDHEQRNTDATQHHCPPHGLLHRHALFELVEPVEHDADRARRRPMPPAPIGLRISYGPRRFRC